MAIQVGENVTIKPSDLRSGNYLQGEHGIFKINAYGIYQIESKINIGLIEPIPLTSDILEKCGFVHHASLGYWAKTWGRNGVHFIKFDEHYSKFSFQLGKRHYKVLDYLHQLQNGWQFLTGEELIVNL